MSQLLISNSSTFGYFLFSALFIGANMVAMQNTLDSLIADIAPKEYRATAFGVNYLVMGLSSCYANSKLGRMLDINGFTSTFSFTSCYYAIIFIFLLIFGRKLLPNKE